ncbi:MAG: prepilin-type N-terminal cleavage/methylation domain-containing protein [Candidatus Microsaccharimonas sp.]
MRKAWAPQLRNTNKNGFTIVELLIVVVVIAILAAITIVAYNGIQSRANNSAAQSAASQAAKKLAMTAATNADVFPQDKATFLSATGLTENAITSYQYTTSSPYTSYCLTTTTNNLSYYTTSTASPVAGACPGHGVNGALAVTNFITNPRAIGGGASWTNQTPTGGTPSYNATGAQDGSSAYQVVVNTAGVLRIGIPQSVGSVTTGDVLFVRMEVYAPVATTVQMEVGIASSSYPRSSNINLSVGWNQIATTVTMNATGSITLVQMVTTSNIPAGQTWRGTKGFVSKGATSYQYADGTSPNWVWNGTVNNSTSTGSGS